MVRLAISDVVHPFKNLAIQVIVLQHDLICNSAYSPYILSSKFQTQYSFMCWMQMLVILTKSVNRCFEKNPKFDMTPLLGGTDVVFSSLIHAFSRLVPLYYSSRVYFQSLKNVL